MYQIYIKSHDRSLPSVHSSVTSNIIILGWGGGDQGTEYHLAFGYSYLWSRLLSYLLHPVQAHTKLIFLRMCCSPRTKGIALQQPEGKHDPCYLLVGVFAGGTKAVGKRAPLVSSSLLSAYVLIKVRFDGGIITRCRRKLFPRVGGCDASGPLIVAL